MKDLHFIDGRWISGNPPLLRAMDHATWLGGGVFDGARAFEDTAPDLDRHCRRAVRSATNLGLRAPLSAGEIEEIVRDGIKQFPKGTALYIRPFLWSESSGLVPDPIATRIIISVSESPLPQPKDFSVCLSPWRRPSADMAPTNAKAVALYAQAGRAARDAYARGFNDAVMLDPLGNVAELSAANIWMIKEGVAHTPIPNGTFLNGITRQRVIRLLRASGVTVYERTITYAELGAADEIFSTGNYAKLLPVTRIDDRALDIGPVYQKARALYWDWAHQGVNRA